MTRSERLIIRLCCRILWDAMDCSRKVTMQTDAVRLALRILMRYCPERWPLTNFWEAVGTEQDIGRAQGSAASYRAVLVQLERAGKQPPAYDPQQAPAVD